MGLAGARSLPTSALVWRFCYSAVLRCCVGAGLLCACSVPLVFNLQFGRRACGPHQGISMLIALGGAVLRAPRHAYTWHQTASLQHLPPCSVGVTMSQLPDRAFRVHKCPSTMGAFLLEEAQDMGCSALTVHVLWVCRVVGTILTWLVSPFVLGGVAVILAFLLLVTQGQRSHFRKDREKLRNEFEQYRKQMQAKVGSITLLLSFYCVLVAAFQGVHSRYYMCGECCEDGLCKGWQPCCLLACPRLCWCGKHH